MREVMYESWVEYSDGVFGYIGSDYDSADEAEKVARERLASQVTSGYLKEEHGGVKAIMVRESKEVRRIEL